jgi:hypothetical protein
MSRVYESASSAPPSFEEAKNTRQKARAAGMNPNYWYAVEFADQIKPGKVTEVVFWKRSIALFRGEDGELRAIENRCAHRQLKLSTGVVDGCNLVCPYHGWTYDGAGKVVDIPHSLFGRDFPKFQVHSYPVKERYGLAWIFPGDPELAEQRKLPEIPDLEGPNRWACVPVKCDWKGHHSMVMDNVSDFTHAFLHRKYQPFWNAELVDWKAEGDRVYLEYDTPVGGGRVFRHFVDQRKVNNSRIKLCYEYPYQWSNTDDQIKHWLFVLPQDEQHTRCFFLFHFKQLKIPGLPAHIPRSVMNPFLRIANEVLIKPLLGEDGFAVEQEQDGYNRHWNAPLAELNPVVKAFQELTIRKWQEHLDAQKASGTVQIGSKPSEARSGVDAAE